MVAPRGRDQIVEILERSGKVERAGNRGLLFHHHALCDRLPDVARCDLDFDHLRISGGGGAGFDRHVPGGSGAASLRKICADGSRDYQEASARSGQTDAGAGDAVGLPFVLAVPDYLFGESAAGDQLVRAALERRLAMGRVDTAVTALRASLRFAAVSNAEEESEDAVDDRYFHHFYQSCGCVLAGGAELRGCEPSGFYGFVARFRGADRVRRIVAGDVLPNAADAALTAAGSSGSSKGVESWQRSLRNRTTASTRAVSTVSIRVSRMRRGISTSFRCRHSASGFC